MSTVQLAPSHPGALQSDHPADAARATTAAPALLGGLILAVAYAAFSHGASTSPAQPRLEVGIDLLAALAGAALIWTGGLRLRAPRLAYGALAGLAAFATWTAITIGWSVAPDSSWIEFNRVLSYVIVLVLAVILGASSIRAVSLAAHGFLVVAVAVTFYGLGQKLFPGLHISGLFDLNQTAQLPRLQQPLGYWNALALFIAMGLPIALARSADHTRSERSRLLALAMVELMLVAIGFTYSRGGVLALVLGLAVGIVLSRARLRSLMWLGTAALATVPPLVFGLAYGSLSTANVSLGRRELAGALLALILGLSVACLVIAGRWLLKVERRGTLDAERSRKIGRRIAIAAGAAVVIAVLAVALSPRGLTGTVSHAWKSFTATRGISVSDPGRLLSADSQNRWVWWKEAAGGFSDRPLGGWGAGTFPVVHMLYRRDTLAVQQPHSMPLEFLVETGVIGAILAIGSFVALLIVGVRTVRSRPEGSERLLAAALLGGAFAYGVHALYDWDWDIPGVTLPALLFLGVLAGSAAERARPRLVPGPGPGARAVGVAALSLALCVVALSAALPSLASSTASSALVAASGRGGLDRAQQEAVLASRLDPLSDAGPRAEASVWLHRLRPARATTYLLEAVRREPSDEQAWISLSYAELAAGEQANALRSAQRALALDPLGTPAARLVRSVLQPQGLMQAPPNQSATAQPLTPQ